MKKSLLCGILFLLLMTGMVHATLLTIGTATYNGSEYKLIWDDDNNGNSVVWLDYSYKSAGSWDELNAWAASLDDDPNLTINLYEGYAVDWVDDAWRLPTTSISDGDDGFGDNQITSEMGHLYYEELGLDADGSTTDELKDTIFDHLIASSYWSGTEVEDDTNNAWVFSMAGGDQFYWSKSGFDEDNEYGLAVRSGQVSVSSIPEPSVVLLMGAGLLGMAATGRKKGRDL